MKEIYLVVLMAMASVVATMPCCDSNATVLPGAYCSGPGLTKTKVKISCSIGYLPLKDIVVKDDKLFTKDSGGFVFASNPTEYCVGEMYQNKSNPEQGRIQIALVCFQPDQSINNGYEMTGILALISVIFLFLTFSVYMFLPQLRDLQGLCYMCLCICMALGFLTLGILQLNPGFVHELCTVTGFLVYFWMMGTFFWMNVICINVYRAVVDASYLKKAERKHYFIYSIYAWGCTIAFLMISLITNFAEGDHLKPGFGGSSCWFQDRLSTWAYFYGPVAILLTANVILFILSSLSLWRQSRKYEVNTLNNLKYKFILSLKLMLVMGISWIFEITSFAHGEYHIIWVITDVFNCLQGVLLFLILVVLRRRAVQGLADAGVCLFITRPLAQKLSPHDDADDQQMLDDEHTEVRLN